MGKRDYYEVLGINRNTSEAELKKAYRRLAMKYHPDRVTGADRAEAEQKFKEAKEAYEMLSDPRKRAAYDQFGHAGVDPTSTQNARHNNFTDIFGDVFGDIFSDGAKNSNRPSRGADLRYSLQITLEQAVFGTTTEIRLPRMVECGDCKGSGAKSGTRPTTCETCKGAGQVRIQQTFFTIQQTCPRCQGQGTIVTQPCPTCRGQGRVEEYKTLSVKIPPGVDTGDRIQHPGEGESGWHNGPSGDLYIQIAIKPHQIFSRDGADLYCDVPISFTAAALGGEIQIPTLDGKVILKIPPGTQTGKLLKLRNKGIKPVRGSAQGDLICRVTIETPVNLTEKQKQLLQELDVSLRDAAKRHSPTTNSWLDTAKKFLETIGINT